MDGVEKFVAVCCGIVVCRDMLFWVVSDCGWVLLGSDVQCSVNAVL